MAYINENNVAYGVLSGDTSEIVDGSITEPKLANNAVSTRTIQNGAVTNAKIANNAVTSEKIGELQVQTVNIDGGAIITNRLAYHAVTEEKTADNAVSTRTIQNGAVDSTKLNNDVLEMFDDKLDYQRITNVDGSPVNLNYLNTHTFTPFKFYYLYKGTDIIPDINTNEYALFFPLTVLSQFIILANGKVYSRQRESTAAAWSEFTITTASIESEISTLRYNAAQAQAAIIRLNDAVNELIGKSTLSVGFDSDGIAVKVSPSTTISAGDFLTNVTTVYFSPSVTNITSGFATTAPNVTDIYIDNTEGNVTIDAYVLSVVNVHYKNDFNFSNMILNSIVNSNTKIADLDARITALES